MTSLTCVTLAALLLNLGCAGVDGAPRPRLGQDGGADDRAVRTGILVHTPEGSDPAWGTLWTPDGTAVADEAFELDVAVPVESGRYLLTDYLNRPFEFAEVDVVEGEVTELALGALLYVGGEMQVDVYNAGGKRVMLRPLSRDRPTPVPARTYLVKDYLGDEVLYAGVAVTADAIMTFP